MAKIKNYHIRVFDDSDDFALQARGGATIVLSEISTGHYVYGISFCRIKTTSVERLDDRMHRLRILVQMKAKNLSTTDKLITIG